MRRQKAIFKSLMIAQIFQWTSLVAQTSHQQQDHKTSHGAVQHSTEDITFLKIPDSSNPSAKISENPYKNEASVESLMISLWALSSNKIPSKETLIKAGLNPTDVNKFINNLTPQQKLNGPEIDLLRKSYTKDSFQQRFEIRKKYLGFIEKFQEQFPQTAEIIPELLTVWGEARNIKGFSDIDSLNQQAKMATVIHVIRNRSEKLKKRFPNSPPQKAKWKVVTKRFQFSAFEPYDPNLSEIAFGPKNNHTIDNISELPRNDQLALKNLAIIISGLNRGEILLSKPLVYTNTYHYLTPHLEKYSKESLAKMSSKISRVASKFKIVKIPNHHSPQFIAAVPRWADQNALISHPPVKIKDRVASSFVTQIVGPSDFIYFRGIK